jgi:hypothetical protein
VYATEFWSHPDPDAAFRGGEHVPGGGVRSGSGSTVGGTVNVRRFVDNAVQDFVRSTPGP